MLQSSVWTDLCAYKTCKCGSMLMCVRLCVCVLAFNINKCHFKSWVNRKGFSKSQKSMICGIHYNHIDFLFRRSVFYHSLFSIIESFIWYTNTNGKISLAALYLCFIVFFKPCTQFSNTKYGHMYKTVMLVYLHAVSMYPNLIKHVSSDQQVFCVYCL